MYTVYVIISKSKNKSRIITFKNYFQYYDELK